MGILENFSKKAMDINFPERPLPSNPKNPPNPNIPLPTNLIVKLYDTLDGRPEDVLEDIPFIIDQNLRYPFTYLNGELGGVANHPLTEPMVITWMYQNELFQ